MARGGSSVGGGRSSGGFGGGSGAASRLSAAAESRRTAAAVAHRPLLSGFSSYTAERSDCRSLYRSYMRFVIEEKQGEDDDYCIQLRQQLEDFCSQYKPVWSGWWTERDNKDLCDKWSKTYDYCVANFGGPESNTSVKEFAERVCKDV